MARRVEEPVNIAQYDKRVPVGNLIGSPPAGTSQPDESLIKALEKRHPEWEKQGILWKRVNDCYDGDLEVMRDYIKKHEREHKTNYTNRRERICYINYCEPVVDLYLSYIYRRPVVRKPLGDLGLPASLAMLKQIQAQQESPAAPSTGPMGPEGPPQAQGEEEGEPQQQQAQQAPAQQKKPGLSLPTKSVDQISKVPSKLYTDASEEEEMPDITQEMARESVMYFIKEGGPQQLAIFNELYEDADLQGNSIDIFMQEAGKDAQVDGHVGILVDAPASEAEEKDNPKNEAERKERNIRPYLVRYKAKDIVDWQLDKHGQFEWVRLLEEGNEPRDPFSSEIKPIKTYITWTKTAWVRITIDDKNNIKDIQEREHDLGEVPLVILYNKKRRNRQLMGDSALNAISAINLSLMNWLSMLDEEVYQKCLSIFVMKASGEDSKEVVFGSSNVVEYPDEPPNFIAPRTEPWKFMLDLIKENIQEIYRIAKMGGGGTGIQIKEAKSGVAHAYEFNETNQALADKADQLEVSENKIHALYAKWWGFEFKGKVTYPDEFGVEDLAQELNFLVQSRSAITSLTAKRELEKKVVKKLLQNNVGDQVMQRIMAEIDANRPEDYKIPGEFVMPGAVEKPSVPGQEAISALLPMLQDVTDPDLLKKMGTDFLRRAKGTKSIPPGIKTVTKPPNHPAASGQ